MVVGGSFSRSDAPWVSLGLFGVVRFIRVHSGRRWFIRGRWVHTGASWGSLGSSLCTQGVVGFIRGRSVDWGASLGSFGVRWYRCVHSGSLGSFGWALGDVGFIQGP